ncbi:MAG: hypothetical protein NXH97_20955 [Rhodobacteraceae bacterium]|nr:hypothetical protein [Paracoccaceae bacterium]
MHLLKKTLRLAFKGMLGLATLVVVMAITPIARLSENAKYIQIDAEACDQFPLSLYHERFPILAAKTPPEHYDRELAAHDYAFALVAAWGAYDFELNEVEDTKEEGANEAAKKVTLPQLDPTWQPLPMDAIDQPWWNAGMSYQVFVRESGEFHDYLVAYRGTEEVTRVRGITDWLLGNFTYLTQSLPIPNQYDTAAHAHAIIQQYAVDNADEKK